MVPVFILVPDSSGFIGYIKEDSGKGERLPVGGNEYIQIVTSSPGCNQKGQYQKNERLRASEIILIFYLTTEVEFNYYYEVVKTPEPHAHIQDHPHYRG
jgi:hypothetical protein